MPLTLKQPPPDDVADVVPSEQELTQGTIDRFRAQIDQYIDGLVEQERVRCPGVPAEALRMTLLRRECRCKAAE